MILEVFRLTSFVEFICREYKQDRESIDVDCTIRTDIHRQEAESAVLRIYVRRRLCRTFLWCAHNGHRGRYDDHVCVASQL